MYWFPFNQSRFIDFDGKKKPTSRIYLYSRIFLINVLDVIVMDSGSFPHHCRHANQPENLNNNIHCSQSSGQDVVIKILRGVRIHRGQNPTKKITANCKEELKESLIKIQK